jgi:hypothetical protein
MTSKDVDPTSQFAHETVVQLRYCGHAHSPFPLRKMQGFAAPAQEFTCGGDLDRCPLSPEQLAQR